MHKPYFLILGLTFSQISLLMAQNDSATIQGISSFKEFTFRKIAPPILEWKDSLPEILQNTTQILRAAIQSSEKPTITLTIDGQLITTKGQIVVSANPKEHIFQTPIHLPPMNRVKIELVATNAGGKTVLTRYCQVVLPPPIPIIKEKRFALLIGNQTYEYAKTLRNPKRDVEVIDGLLKSVGFETMIAMDANYLTLKQQIRAFARKLRDEKYSVGFVYYSGHGLQSDGVSFLVPTDGKYEFKTDLEEKAVSLEFVLKIMEEANQNTNIIVVDACREAGGLKSWMRTKGFNEAEPGLAPPQRQPSGSLLAFATAPNDVAEDGLGENSPYVEAWKLHFQKGISITDFLSLINGTVYDKTKGDQSPWYNNSIRGIFKF
jgi:Caspase domain